MAPERFSAKEADVRADVYALACVLYECLTGEQPYPGDSLEQQYAGHVYTPPPQPSAGNPALSRFDRVTDRGLGKDPDQRYASTVELARAARDATTDPIPRQAPPIPPPTVAHRRPLHRRRSGQRDRRRACTPHCPRGATLSPAGGTAPATARAAADAPAAPGGTAPAGPPHCGDQQVVGQTGQDRTSCRGGAYRRHPRPGHFILRHRSCSWSCISRRAPEPRGCCPDVRVVAYCDAVGVVGLSPLELGLSAGQDRLDHRQFHPQV
jgi:hypothetical protein